LIGADLWSLPMCSSFGKGRQIECMTEFGSESLNPERLQIIRLSMKEKTVGFMKDLLHKSQKTIIDLDGDYFTDNILNNYVDLPTKY